MVVHIVRDLRRGQESRPDENVLEALGLPAADGGVYLLRWFSEHPELYRIIEEAQFVAHDVYREHYLSFADAYRRNLAGARERGEIADGGHGAREDEARGWALIGMSVFLGMRYGIWDRDLTPAEVADAAIALVSEGLRKR